MNQETKAILFQLLADLQDLRTNQILLTISFGVAFNPDVTQKIRNKVSEQVDKDYQDLRIRIEKLQT